ncbi:MAG: archaeosortase/exosortase family protein [Phycisphaeraceae bacterium]
MKHANQAVKTLARNGWRPRHAVCLAACVGLAVVMTLPAWQQMLEKIILNDYARTSVLVLPIMTWLVWVRRARFRFVRPGGPGLGLIVLISGIQIYYFAQFVYGLNSIGQLGAVTIVAGAFLLCTGKSVVRQFLPAWAILPLLVPFPDTLAVMIAKPIQLFEAEAIAGLYGLLGVSVKVISSPGTSQVLVGDTALPIDSVCKGLPTILSLMLISYGFVFASPMRPVVRTGLLVITPAIALLCSAISLGGTLWLYDGRSALMTADLIRAFSEWATVLIAFLLIAMSLKLLAWASVPVHQYHLAATSN